MNSTILICFQGSCQIIMTIKPIFRMLQILLFGAKPLIYHVGLDKSFRIYLSSLIEQLCWSKPQVSIQIIHHLRKVCFQQTQISEGECAAMFLKIKQLKLKNVKSFQFAILFDAQFGKTFCLVAVSYEVSFKDTEKARYLNCYHWS